MYMNQLLSEMKEQGIEIPEHDIQAKRDGCITSIDHLLRIETSKLNALKQHKKGLLQQLFPHGSETVPQLRFPEYTNGEKWQKEKIVSYLSFQTGIPFRPERTNEFGKGIRLIQNRDLKSDDKAIYYDGDFDKEYIVKDSDIIVGMTRDFTLCLWGKGKALLYHKVVRISAYDQKLNPFFYYCLTKHLKSIQKTEPFKISISHIQNIFELVPSNSKEMQKIGSCLSSIDEIINSRAKRIEALTDHKKGLLQELFPKNDIRI